MFKKIDRKAIRNKKHLKIRKKIQGTQERPRLAVYRSLHHIYAQLIDDTKGVTLLAASTLEQVLKAEMPYGGNISAAKAVGSLIAKKALDKGISKVIFDRGGSVYHGRIAALAGAAREAGLEF